MPSITTQNIAAVASAAVATPSSQLGKRSEAVGNTRADLNAANQAAVQRAISSPPRSDKDRPVPSDRQVSSTYSPQNLKRDNKEAPQEGRGRVDVTA